MKPVLLYLHGFNSSPASWKAQALARFIDAHALAIDYRVPRLPFVPADAMSALVAEVESLAMDRRVVLVGSSMGGFYASCLAERFALRAVLINPAVHPHKLLRDYLGENRNFHDGLVQNLDEQHISQLRALERPLRQAGAYWVLVQTGDETLDYRLATARYRAHRMTIAPGGSHGFDDFEQFIPAILAYLDLPLPS